MHVLMLKEVIACCRRRQTEGDCPTGPAFSVEQLEDAVVQLADRLHEAEGRLLAAAPSAVAELGVTGSHRRKLTTDKHPDDCKCAWCIDFVDEEVAQPIPKDVLTKSALAILLSQCPSVLDGWPLARWLSKELERSK